MTLKVAQVHRNYRHSIGDMYHFLFVECSNVSTLHLFQYNTTFTVYVTASDLEKSFNFDKIIETRQYALIFPLA